MNLKLQRRKILKCLLGKEIVNSAINPSLKSMHSKMRVFLIHNKPKGFMVLAQGNKVLKLVKSLNRLKQVSMQ